jgi:DTW domain-containing protein YfiP
MEKHLCICAEIPQVKTKTRIVILMQWKESARSSNTGRLAHLALPNSRVILRGAPEQPFDPTGLSNESSLVLFPGKSAEELTPAHGKPQARTLYILDGTWRQARKMLRREAFFSPMQRVKLPVGKPSEYFLRKPKKEGFLSTYESICRSLSILEGRDLAPYLMPVFHSMVQKTLISRGRLELAQRQKKEIHP